MSCDFNLSIIDGLEGGISKNSENSQPTLEMAEKAKVVASSLAASSPVVFHLRQSTDNSYAHRSTPTQRLEAAKLAIPQQSWQIPSFIRDRLATFCLSEEQQFEMAKICCTNEPSVVGLLDSFQLSGEKRKEIALLAVRKDFSVISQLPKDMRPCLESLVTQRESYGSNNPSDWAATTPDEVSQALTGFAQKMSRALADGDYHHHEELALTTALGAVDYWRLALTKEQFSWVSQQGFFQAIFDLEAPFLRSSLIHAVVDSARNEGAFSQITLSDRVPKAKLMKTALMHLLLEDPAERSVLLTSMQGAARQLKDTKSFCMLWKTLHLLSMNEPLNRQQKTAVIQAVCADPRQFMQQITSLCIVLECQQTALLQNETLPEFSLLAQQAFKSVVPFSEEFDMQQFIEVFSAYRQPDAMMLYAADFMSLGNPQLLESLGAHISSVLQGTYKQERYETDRNPHLHTIQKDYPTILRSWSQNSELIPLVEMFPTMGVPEDLRTWLTRTLVEENHVAELGFQYSDLEKCLQGDDVALAGLQRELYDARSSLVNLEDHQNSSNLTARRIQKKGQNSSIHGWLALQNKLCQLAKSRTIVNSQRLLQELVDNTLIAPESEFRKHLVRKLEQLNQELLLSAFSVCETDNAEDLLLYGSESTESCQAIGGDPRYNQGLLGSLHHGQTRLIAIKDTQGRIVARSLIRLLWDGERPVLFLEKLYNNQKKNSHFPLAIEAMVKRCADRLGCPVAMTDGSEGPFAKNLRSEGGPAPEEYVDSCNGLCANGRFEIKQVKWFYMPSQLCSPETAPPVIHSHQNEGWTDSDWFANDVNPYDCGD